MKFRIFRAFALAFVLLFGALWTGAAIVWNFWPALSRQPLGTLAAMLLIALVCGLMVIERVSAHIEESEEQHLRAGLRGQQSPSQNGLLAIALDAAHDLEFQRDQEARNAVQLQRVLESLDTAIIAADGQRRVVYANSAASRIFHLGELPPRGKRLTALPRIPQLLSWAQQVIASGQAEAGRITLPDERTLQAYVTPFESTPPGFVVLARDITDKVSLENSRRDFIAGVSHELRTPLTSIQGYTELLMQDDEMPLETRHQFLEIILSNTGRLTKLAQDLVTLSSIETGTYPFHFQTVDARTLPGPAVDVLLPHADEQQCEILLEDFESGQVRVDPDAMHRVLLNLIDNAIVHGGKGISIHLSGAVRGKEYEMVVRDTGVGIGTMDQPRVFERFYRVDKSHSRLGGGSGLGLALVKHIVREHGGQIELNSGLGKGTAFRIRLPLASAQEATGTQAGEVES